MPVTPTYPGVYIEELPSAVRTVSAVSTSVTAFVGGTDRGPVGTPVTLTSFADFERRFGGLSDTHQLGHVIQHFYLNGGSVAVVVRLAPGAKPAGTDLAGSPLTVTARDPGDWSNGLRVAVDRDLDATGDDARFTLRITNLGSGVTEVYRDLTVTPGPRFVEDVVNAASSTVTVTASGATELPDPSGTVSKQIDFSQSDHWDQELRFRIDGLERTVQLVGPDDAAPASLPALARLLQQRLNQAAPTLPGFARARVSVLGSRLRLISGQPDTTVEVLVQSVPGLDLKDRAQPDAYPLVGGVPGGDLTMIDYVGDVVAKTGLQALRDVTDVNLLSLPDVADLGLDDAIGVLAEAERLCEDQRILLLVDPPSSWISLADAQQGLPDLDVVRSSYAALYFPRIELTDPLTGRLRAFPPSGAVAGVMARTDTERGVWKAPAGTEARLAGVRALTVPLTDLENGLLNPLGVNVLRNLPLVGPVVWGARTLLGADAPASQWKYVPVRRLALMLEESLFRGTQWVVFEPNDEQLWGQIRLNVQTFLQSLFRQGAFQGSSAREAYFVKCDSETTTQDDINRGVVNILVGFAPLKPAEFVIVQIEQLAGQIEG
jgi:phage tail sheath protein FI